MQALRRFKLGTRARLLLRGYPELWPYATIEGWLSVDEAITLYELARGLGDGATVVEIGSYQGKSSVVLGRALRDKAGARLVCIDPFNADGDAYSRSDYRAGQEGDGGLLRAFRANVDRAGVAGLVQIQRGYSHEVAGAFAGEIDLLFLDGDHSYEAVRRDFDDWTPRLRPGGWLCLHDVGHPDLDGPRRVADESVRGRDGWLEPRRIDSLLVARRG